MDIEELTEKILEKSNRILEINDELADAHEKLYPLVVERKKLMKEIEKLAGL